jgi:hypothetical protein
VNNQATQREIDQTVQELPAFAALPSIPVGLRQELRGVVLSLCRKYFADSADIVALGCVQGQKFETVA